ncbi:MAG: DUF2066 domain-containing protein [Gammaproteobacteria bacterium]|jgi:hypothetical protein
MTMPFTSAFRRSRTRRAGRLAALAVASCTLFSGAATATQTVVIGEVEVQSSGDAAYVEAMRAALVRATGRRSAATDPAFATLLQDARRYVQIFRPATGSNPARITLDVVAIERVIAALGQTTWSRERPVVLGLITAAPEGADPALVRAQLERAALDRGLPLRLVSAVAAGVTPGVAVTPEAALLAARRAGADVALVGTADGAEWQWTLFDGASATVFYGDVAVGVEGAADNLALGSLAAVAQPLGEAEFRVRGVRSLKDYADVQKMLVAMPAIKSADLVATDAEGAWFRVEVSGGAAGLAEALATQPRLKREGGSNSRDYRYGP